MLIKTLYRIIEKKNNLFIYRCIKLFLNVYYPIYCIVSKINGKNKYANVVISLTSFPERINKLHLVIQSLLRQEIGAEKIVLWLANSQFESKEKLPKSLLKLEKYGLEIKFCEDLRSHKKYYYTMKNYPEYKIITVDDDTFYPEDLVKKLFECSERYPETVCCNLAHEMTIRNNTILPYVEWNSGSQGKDIPSDFLVPIGCEGVLYPPNLLNDNLFNKNDIKDLCPLADDLWLKSMATLNGIKSVKTSKYSIPYVNLLTAKKGSLTSVNVHRNKNDEQLKKIIERYPSLLQIWK